VPRRRQDFDAMLDDFRDVEENFEKMERPRFELVPADVSGARFKYLASDWGAVEIEISPLPLFERLEASRWRWSLEYNARQYFVAKSSPAPLSLSERMRRWETVWRKIDEVQEAIQDAAEAHFGGALEPKPLTVTEIDEQLESLHNFRLIVASRATELERNVISWPPAPVHSARVEYFHGVLRTWMMAGGKLRLPSDGLSGPLARFFFAAVGPVMEADQPSRSSLRDIVAAFDASRATIVENTRTYIERLKLPEASKVFWETYLREASE
jgi:hypothetical protein